MADWYPGEKVICVYNGFLDVSDAPELEEGAIYTIQRVLPSKHGHHGLEIAEVRARREFQAFDERRFRPLSAFSMDVGTTPE
jgi:hypothetical protein